MLAYILFYIKQDNKIIVVVEVNRNSKFVKSVTHTTRIHTKTLVQIVSR